MPRSLRLQAAASRISRGNSLVLHHVPAAFALATPIGIIFSNSVVLSKLLSSGLYAALLGLVAGNFLHVSTTILFETSPEYRLNWPTLGATLAGLLLALVVA